MTVTLYLPLPDAPPDEECPETLAGGHALILGNVRDHSLVIEYGDCSFGFHCECGATMAYDLRPNQAWDAPVARWLEHVPGGAARQPLPHCQCGEVLGKQLQSCAPKMMERVALAWEKHSMSLSAARRG